MVPSKASPAAGARACSFCGKTDLEVRLVAGPANICDACVRLACAVLGIKIEPESEGSEAEPATDNKR